MYSKEAVVVLGEPCDSIRFSNLEKVVGDRLAKLKPINLVIHGWLRYLSVDLVEILAGAKWKLHQIRICIILRAVVNILVEYFLVAVKNEKGVINVVQSLFSGIVASPVSARLACYQFNLKLLVVRKPATFPKNLDRLVAI